MQTITTVAELRCVLANARRNDKRVGFVPTMGYLHDGHLALVAASRARCDVTVVSIFVNPTQFGPNEDLSTYPRDFLRDQQLCRDAGVAIVFAPEAQAIYPDQFETFVEPGELASPLCGALPENAASAQRAPCSTGLSATRYVPSRMAICGWP